MVYFEEKRWRLKALHWQQREQQQCRPPHRENTQSWLLWRWLGLPRHGQPLTCKHADTGRLLHPAAHSFYAEAHENPNCLLSPSGIWPPRGVRRVTSAASWAASENGVIATSCARFGCSSSPLIPLSIAVISIQEHLHVSTRATFPQAGINIAL